MHRVASLEVKRNFTDTMTAAKVAVGRRKTKLLRGPEFLAKNSRALERFHDLVTDLVVK